MDDSNNHDANSSQDLHSAPEPTGGAPSLVSPAVPTKSRWYKRKLFWVPVLIILVAVAAGMVYLYYASLNKSQPQQPVHDNVGTKTEATLNPQALVYVSSAEKVAADCLQRTDTVHYVNLSDQKVTDAVTIDDYQGAADFAAYHDTVVLATEPSCASKNGPSLWLSNDSGKTYKKIYTAETSSRITSIAFSTDGSDVAFGLSGKSKTARAIMVKSGKVRDLFSDNQTEHFSTFYDVKAYDHDHQRVYYLENCDLCDRANEGPLLQHDLKSGKSSIVLESAKSLSYGTVISSDASRIVRAEFTSDEASQLRQFTIDEFDLMTKKRVNFAAYAAPTSAGIVRVGYTAEGSVYYTAGKKVMIIKEGGETSELAQLPDQADGVYYVSKSRIIYRTGDQSGGEVIDYDIGSGKSTRLLKYEYPTIPLGISYRTAQ